MNKCTKCGRENGEGVKICTFCGNLLLEDQAATKALENPDNEDINPRWGSSRFSSRIHLTVFTDDGERKVTIDTANMSEMVMGRVDPDTNDAPEIDLTAFGAQDKGVSRRHSAIIRKDGSLHVVDKGSYNGTFLNGQRLIAEQPRVLRDGDDIRLGYLVVRVSFEQRSNN